MPLPEVGEDHDTLSLSNQPLDVVDDDDFDEVPPHANAHPARPPETELSIANPGEHGQLTPPETRTPRGEPHDLIEWSEKTTTVTSTVPTKEDDPSHSGVIERPRSSGEPVGQNFKFPKAKVPQLDMTRRRGSKSSAYEAAGSQLPVKQDIITRSVSESQQNVETGSHRDNLSSHKNGGDKNERVHRSCQNPVRPIAGEVFDTNMKGYGANEPSQPKPHRSPNPGHHTKASGLAPLPQALKVLQQRGQQAHLKLIPGSEALDDVPRNGQGPQHLNALPTSTEASSTLGEAPSPVPRISSMTSHIEQSFKADSQDVLRNQPTSTESQHSRRNYPEDTSESPTAAQKFNPSATRRSVASRDVRARLPGQSLMDRRISQEPTQHGAQFEFPGSHSRDPLPIPSAAQRDPPLTMRRPVPNAPMQKPGRDDGPALIHRVSPRNVPVKVTKSGQSSRNLRSMAKSTNPPGQADDLNVSITEGPRIHSSQVLGIWQKLYWSEQQELSSKEKSQREEAEKELARLKWAEKEHEVALKAAKKARLNSSTKLQQVQSANDELQLRIRELEESLKNTADRLKAVQDNFKQSSDLSSTLKNEVRSLTAKSESLINLNEAEREKASVELRNARQELEKTRQELNVQRVELDEQRKVRQIHEDQLSEMGGRLAEERDNMGNLRKDFEATNKNYDEIKKKVENWDGCLKSSLASISETLAEVLSQQPTNTSIDDVLRAVRMELSQFAVTEQLETMLQSFQATMQSKLDNTSKAEEATLKAASDFEARLFSRLQEIFKPSTPPRGGGMGNKEKIAVLEERCSDLRAINTTIKEQLKTAQFGEASARNTLGELKHELCKIEDKLFSVDSARLRELESDKARVDQELRDSYAKLREEQEKCRALTETEIELSQAVTNLKTQLNEFGASITRLQAEKSDKDHDVARQIEKEKEDAQAHFSNLCDQICQIERASYANKLHEEREKSRRATDNLQSQALQIATLKDQIRRKDMELQKATELTPTATAEARELRHQLDIARKDIGDTQVLQETLTAVRDQLNSRELQISHLHKEKEALTLSGKIKEQARTEADQRAHKLQSSLESARRDSAKSSRDVQEQLKVLRSDKQDCEEKYQAAQEKIREAESQLANSETEREEFRQDVEKLKAILIEREQDAAAQMTENDERECQWAAELGETWRLLQEALVHADESEASHQIKCQEYEERLRDSKRALERYRTERLTEWDMQLSPHAIDTAKQALTTSKDSNALALDPTTPVANSSTQRRPRRKVDRSTNFSNEENVGTQLIGRESQDEACNSESGTHRQLTAEPVFAAGLLASQEHGQYEALAEHGVSRHPPEGEPLVEIPETLPESLSKPALFSDFDQAYDYRQENSPSSDSFSNMPTSDVIELGKEVSTSAPDKPSLLEQDTDASSPTQRLSGDMAAAMPTQTSTLNPFFGESRPVSRANVRKRIDSSTMTRQGSVQTTSEVLNRPTLDVSRPQTPARASNSAEGAPGQDSSPPFMGEPSQKSMVLYGHHLQNQLSTAQDNLHHFHSPAAAVKRRASRAIDSASSKRTKTVSSAAAYSRSSPRVTRASARAGPRSHISESQSQDQRAGESAGSQKTSLNSESQSQTPFAKISGSQSHTNSAEGSQFQSQGLSNVLPASRMRSSLNSSSSAARTSPARRTRRRKSSVFEGRFDEEIHRR